MAFGYVVANVNVTDPVQYEEYKKFISPSLEKESAEDIDPLETKEWIESLNSVVEREGPRRANYLVGKLINQAYLSGSNLPYNQKTPYINTIPSEMEDKSPGDQTVEAKIRSLIRWNAACMVVRANKKYPELGGHIATFASAATLYDVYKNRELFSLDDVTLFLVGGAVSFISAFFAVRGLIRFITKHDFTVFAWYRIAFGIIVLVSAQMGWVDWGNY